MSRYIHSCGNCRHQPCAHRVPIFSSLDAEELSMVSSLITTKKYSKGEMIILEGSNPESLLSLTVGK